MCGDRPSIELNPDAASRLLRALSDDPHAPESSAPAHVSIPGYTIDRPLGEGGGGSVYRAFRNGSDRPLALKVLRARAGGPEAQRAWRELEILEQLRLPALPRLIDYGSHDGHLYFATEFIDGLTLERHCREHNLGRRERVDLLVRVADAVQSLHERGVIHRDIKPSNIIVTPKGAPMLVDLGLAIDSGAAHSMTITAEGQPVGTPAFMAPEQARGERSKISTRTDVYALGATAYLILTGSTPHDVDTSIHEAVRRVAQDEPREARKLDDSLTRPLSAVLGKACAREAEKRYASAAEVGEDLRRWLRGEVVAAGAAGAWTHVVRWVGRHPVLATVMTCTAVFAGGIVGYSLVRTGVGIPDYVTLDPDRTVARLFDRFGTELHEWRTPVTRGISGVEVHDRPSQFGGGRVVLTRIDTGSNKPWSRQLAMWTRPDSLNPEWNTPSAEPAIKPPPSARDDNAATFHAGKFAVADVFPDIPGDEIIVIHNQDESSLTCIRVYDFDGNRLFEAWHDGGIQALAWLSTPRLILCAGLNQEVDWNSILRTDELAPLPSQFPERQWRPRSAVNSWPIVVFAVKPERDRTLGWIHAPDPSHLASRRLRVPTAHAPDAADPDAHVAFYKWLVPGVPPDYFTLAFATGDGAAWTGNSTRLVFGLRDGNSFSWDICADGAALPGVLGDSLKAIGLNPYEIFHFENQPGQ